MRTVYRALLSASNPYAGIAAPMTRAGIAARLTSAVVHEWYQVHDGGYELTFESSRASTEDALEELVLATELAGLDVVQIVIERSVSYVLEGAVLGGGGSGAAALTRTRQIGAIALCVVVGSIVGGLIGAQKRKLISRHQALRASDGAWNYQALALGAVEAT